MLLRKLNAALSLLTALMFFDHSIFLSIWMLSDFRIEKSADAMPFILAGLMVLHALISILLGILGHKGAEKRKCNAYPKLNAETFIQRASGILMLLLLGAHIAGAATHMQPKILHSILQTIFFLSAFAHISVSVGRSLITLGIGNARVIRVVDIAMKFLCLAVFAMSMVALFRAMFPGGAI